MDLTIYVPREGSLAASHVIPGSAIVGALQASEKPGRVLCYFEGKRRTEGDGVPWTYAQKLLHAAGRLIQGYPTIAKAAFASEDLIAVGTYDGSRFVVTSIDDPDALTAWSGESIGQIVGQRLRAGPHHWDKGARLADELRPEGRNDLLSATNLFRSQAGQILLMDTSDQTCTVYEYDDPELPEVLQAHSVDATRLSFILGAHPPTAIGAV